VGGWEGANVKLLPSTLEAESVFAQPETAELKISDWLDAALSNKFVLINDERLLDELSNWWFVLPGTTLLITRGFFSDERNCILGDFKSLKI
jgi:hypothetical protein